MMQQETTILMLNLAIKYEEYIKNEFYKSENKEYVKSIDDEIGALSKPLNLEDDLELGYINEVNIESEKLFGNEDEVHQLILDCEDYLQENYNCIDDDLSGYVYSKELSFNDIEEFYNHFNILEEQLNKRYKI